MVFCDLHITCRNVYLCNQTQQLWPIMLRIAVSSYKQVMQVLKDRQIKILILTSTSDRQNTLKTWTEWLFVLKRNENSK